MQNRTYHNPEYLQKKKDILWRRVYIVSGVLALLLVGFVLLSRWSKLSIDTVTVHGAVLLSVPEIQKSTLDDISGTYWYVIGKKNALLYPHDGLVDYLRQQFPRIDSISVGLENYHTVTVTLTERQPVALWCDTTPEAIASSSDSGLASNCYFLDRDGFVFSHAPDFSGDAYFKYYGLLPYESAIGSSYLSQTDTFGQLSAFVKSVKALNITPLYITAQSQHDFEMHVYGGGRILFDDKTPLADTAHNLQVLLHTEGLVPQKDGQLLVEYVDLRFGNKLYYKVKG